jgi:hypothetical protein
MLSYGKINVYGKPLIDYLHFHIYYLNRLLGKEAGISTKLENNLLTKTLQMGCWLSWLMGD